MPLHRLLAFLLLALSLAACSTSTPRPVPTNTPAPTHTTTQPATVTPSPTSTSTTAPQALPPIITSENISLLGPINQWQQGDGLGAYTWSPDGQKLLISTADALTLLDSGTQKEIWRSAPGYGIDYSKDGKWVASVTGAEIHIHDAVSGRIVDTLAEGPCTNSTHVRFSPDGRQLAVSDGSVIYLLDRQHPACNQPFQTIKAANSSEMVAGLLFSPDGGTLIGVTDQQLLFWNVSDGKAAGTLPGSFAAFHPGGRWLASGNTDHLTLYDWPSRRPVRTFPEYHARSISFSPDGFLLVAASSNGAGDQLNFYNVDTGELIGAYHDPAFVPKTVSFRPDGRQIIIQGRRGQVDQSILFQTLGTNTPWVTPAVELQDPNATPWYQPRPLRLATRSPQIFPLLSEPLYSQQSTPTPINTPAAKAPLYRLKAWSENDGINLINRMVDYAHAGDVYGPSTSRPGFTILQDPIRTTALEYLLRFPGSPHEVSVRWRLALSDAILGRSDSDNWIADQIAQGLNDGAIDPKDINSALAPYGFVVRTKICPIQPECYPDYGYTDASPLVITGMFGDGGKTQIIQINTVEYVTGSMLAALHQDPQGRFFVLPIYSGWRARYTERIQVDVRDLTGDGRPEVQVDVYSINGSMQDQVTYIYHWLGEGRPDSGRFVEVTDGQIYSYLDGNYVITPGGEKDSPGTLSLINPHLDYREEETYRWNGFAFDNQSNRIVFPLSADQIFRGALDRAMQNGQFQEISDSLQQPLDPADINKIGPGAQDYITFQRAVNAALQFKSAEARKDLQSLLQSPAYPKSKFLDVVRSYQFAYRQETDIYRACQAALNTMDRVIAPYKNSSDESKKIEEALGYDALFYDDVCSLKVAFRQLAKKVAESRPDRILPQLAQYGIIPDFKTHLDFNGDGIEDWLLSLGGKFGSSWLLLSGQAASDILYLGGSYEAPTRFEVVHLPGSDREAYLLTDGYSFWLFRLYPGDGGVAFETLLDEYGVLNYQILSGDDSFDILLNQNPKNKDPQVREHWDKTLGRFITYSALEQELLLQNHPADAIREIPKLLPLLNRNTQASYYPWLEPARLRYLLALAYELSGDTARAAQAYYDLWKTYPNQPYAILAREKLEPIQP